MRSLGLLFEGKKRNRAHQEARLIDRLMSLFSLAEKHFAPLISSSSSSCAHPPGVLSKPQDLFASRLSNQQSRPNDYDRQLQTSARAVSNNQVQTKAHALWWGRTGSGGHSWCGGATRLVVGRLSSLGSMGSDSRALRLVLAIIRRRRIAVGATCFASHLARSPRRFICIRV